MIISYLLFKIGYSSFLSALSSESEAFANEVCVIVKNDIELDYCKRRNIEVRDQNHYSPLLP